MTKLEQMLDECEENSHLLTDWECKFVDNVQYQLAHGDDRLTFRQAQKLTQIVEKIHGGEKTTQNAY